MANQSAAYKQRLAQTLAQIKYGFVRPISFIIDVLAIFERTLFYVLWSNSMPAVKKIEAELKELYKNYIQYDQFGRMTNCWFKHDPNNNWRPQLTKGRYPDDIRIFAYWKTGEPYGPPVPFFTQMRYLPVTRAIPDLDIALDGAALDTAFDVHRWVVNAQGAVKVWMAIKVRYEPINPLDTAHPPREVFLASSGQRFFIRQGPITSWTNPYLDAYREIQDAIKDQHARYLRDTSGLALTGVLELTLKAVQYKPLGGGTYKDLPKHIKDKKAVVNIKNHDDNCFAYAILYATDLRVNKDHGSRVAQYYPLFAAHKVLSTLDYPVEVTAISGIEDQLEMRINVFSFFDDEGKAIHPYYISDKQFPTQVNMLYWKNHYAPISSIPRLFFKITKYEHQKHICLRCLGHFTTAATLATHEEHCKRPNFSSVIYTLPAEGAKNAELRFTNFRYMTRAPFVIYADFESNLSPIDQQTDATRLTQHHHVCAAAAILVSTVPELNNKIIEHAGEHALTLFCNSLIEWEKTIINHFQRFPKMTPLTDEEEAQYQNAVVCYLCHRPFNERIVIRDNEYPDFADNAMTKVPDHDHVTGKFFGAAHQSCNLLRPVQYVIPVFFHNLRGYDEHLLVHGFPKHKEREIKVIGQTMEKYMQIQWGKHMVFRDSLQFLSASLDSLAQSLAKSDRTDFERLHAVIADKYPGAPVEMLERKGVFCYDYIDTPERLREVNLPPRERFFSKLTNTECSEEDYAYAQRVWTTFGCTSLLDYMVLYLRTDICLLADVFQRFRRDSLREYELDPAYFITAPHLS